MSVETGTTGTRPEELALPLRDVADLDPLIERIGDARVVCVARDA
jgi:hypothetical protein